MTKSNQGRDLTIVMVDVDYDTIKEMAEVIRQSLSHHPNDSACECSALEALAFLYSKQYVVTKL